MIACSRSCVASPLIFTTSSAVVMGASGLRSSCPSMAKNSSLRRSATRAACDASSARERSCSSRRSASLRAVTSTITERTAVSPSGICTGAAQTCVSTQRPSLCFRRTSTPLRVSPAASFSMFARNSGSVSSVTGEGFCPTRSSVRQPKTCSNAGLTHSTVPSRRSRRMAAGELSTMTSSCRLTRPSSSVASRSNWSVSRSRRCTCTIMVMFRYTEMVEVTTRSVCSAHSGTGVSASCQRPTTLTTNAATTAEGTSTRSSARST